MRLVALICVALLAARSVAQELETTVVTTKPAFGETVPDVRDLVLRQGDHEWSFSWECHQFGLRAPAKLDPEKVYTFTVVSSRLQGPAVERVEHDGKVIYDRSVCDVHRIAMRAEKVPFVFGLAPSEDPAEAKDGEPSIRTVNQLFPNFRDFAYAGCVVEAGVRATVYVCPQCRKSYADWKNRQDSR